MVRIVLMSLQSNWYSTINLNEFEGQVPERVHSKKTDFDFQTVPRAIYNDFIAEMQLREEGYSGSMKVVPIVQMQPIRFDGTSESLSFLSRVPPQPEPEPISYDSEESLDEDGSLETRTVVMTDWGIDILNFRQQDPIIPLDKPSITSPLEKKVYQNKPRAIFKDFSSTVRYSSWMNHGACTSKSFRDQAHKNCNQMERSMLEATKKINLRYKRKFVPRTNTRIVRGLSFRGRGLLDMRMGWAKPSDFEDSNLGGDIADFLHKTENEVAVTLREELNEVQNQTVSSRPSLKYISSTLSNKEVPLKNVGQPDSPKRGLSVRKLQSPSKSLLEYEYSYDGQKDTSSSSSNQNRKVKEDAESKAEENQPFIENATPNGTPTNPKRISLLKSFGEESKNILEQTGMKPNNQDSPLRVLSRRNTETETPKRDSFVGSSTTGTKANDLIAKRYSLLSEPKATETAEEDTNVEDWIAQEKKNLFGNWRAESVDILEPESTKATQALVRNRSIREETSHDRKDSGTKVTTMNQNFELKDNTPKSEEKKQEKPLSRLEMMIKKNQEVAQEQAMQNIKQAATTEADSENRSVDQVTTVKVHNQTLEPKTMSRLEKILFEATVLPSIEKGKTPKDSPLSLTETPTNPEAEKVSADLKIDRNASVDFESSISPAYQTRADDPKPTASVNLSSEVNQLQDHHSLEDSVEETKPKVSLDSLAMVNTQKEENSSHQPIDTTKIVEQRVESVTYLKEAEVGVTPGVGRLQTNETPSTTILTKSKSTENLKEPKEILNSKESLKETPGDETAKKKGFFKRMISAENLKSFGLKKSSSKGSVQALESNKKSNSRLSLIDSKKSKSKSTESLAPVEAEQLHPESKKPINESQESVTAPQKEEEPAITTSSTKLTGISDINKIEGSSVFEKQIEKHEVLPQEDSRVNTNPHFGNASLTDRRPAEIEKLNKPLVSQKESWEIVGDSPKPQISPAIRPLKESEPVQLAKDKASPDSESPKFTSKEEKASPSDMESTTTKSVHADIVVGPKTGRFLNVMDIAAIESRNVLKSKPDLAKNVDSATVKEEKQSNKDIKYSEEKLPELPKKTLEAVPSEKQKEVVKDPVKSSPEDILAAVQLVTWKNHKVEIKVLEFELVAYEQGKSKLFKEYLPIHLRRIIGLELEKANTVIINCCIPRGKDKEGSELKKIAITFGDASQARLWRDNMVELTFGGFYEQSLKREILILAEKSDKDSQKLIEKNMLEVFEVAKRTCKVEVVQYNEFSVGNILEKHDFKKLGNIACTNESFLPRLQQVLVRNQHCLSPQSLPCESDPIDAAVDLLRSCIGKSKIGALHVSALTLKRKEDKLLGMFKKK